MPLLRSESNDGPSRRQPTVHRQPVVSWASRIGARWLPLSDTTGNSGLSVSVRAAVATTTRSAR